MGLVVSLFVLALASLAQADDFSTQVARNFTQMLEARAYLNWNEPPYTEESRHYGLCRRFPYSPIVRNIRRQLIRYPSGPVRVRYDTISQRRVLNLKREPMTIRQEDSQWLVQGVSKTWHAGATLTQGKVAISGGTAHTTFDQTMQVTGRNLEESCPGGHACHFEDWVYYAEWTGRCRTQVMNKNGDICRDKAARIFESGRRFCRGLNSLKICTSRLECTLRLPIRDASGSPLSTTVFIRESHVTPPLAVAVDGPCIFRLDDRRWYDSDADTFWTKYDVDADGEQRWVLRGEFEPVPAVPEKLLGECRLPGDELGKRDLGVEGGFRTVDVKVVGGFGSLDGSYEY
ncbi:hypothetical protein CDD80_3785 [Ophiocordyceps camponoti-rufipedis]|uniref:Uncharacterized protein n=1 Tax=Ophiocordyceps camponoti-rufipedis TaxID=2004952 RepID=A0A2C5ZJ77_9HYPO|nr:hypothetical protein CDD80_3785 [Ophiocordyceps camponoti-rufipedis]